MLKENCRKIEEEVLNKFKVEDSKRGAYTPLKWRRVRRSKKYWIRKWGEHCWARIFSWFREYNLQRIQSMKERESDQKEEWMQTTVGASVSCWPQIARKLGCMQDWKTPCRNGTNGLER